jgi:hypothetical protein
MNIIYIEKNKKRTHKLKELEKKFKMKMKKNKKNK